MALNRYTFLIVAFFGVCRAQSNEGNEFALVFFENVDFIPTFTVFVTTPEDNPVSFTISSQFEEFYEEGVAMPNNVTSIHFNQSFALVNTTDRGKAIIVKAQGDHKLVVYGANEAQHTTDAFLALPSVSIELGTYKYINAMATPWGRFDSFIGIVAFKNNTNISITPNINTTIGSTFTAAGTTTQITLHKYESLLIRQKGDLTGTRVISDKPISFITGHQCTNVPPDIGYCDHLVEQIPPVQNWGKRFATVPLKTRLDYDRFKVVAGEDFTTVQIECTQSDGQSGYSASFILQEGGFRDINISSTDYCWIEGDKRIILLQFSVGQEVDNVLSDPFMAMIPPVDQYSNGYTLATVPDGVQNYIHFMNLYIPKDFFQPSEIFLNGQPLNMTGHKFVPIKRQGVIEVYGVQVNISGGVQVLGHATMKANIGVLVYGFGSYNSYGYPGGLKLKDLSQGGISLSTHSFHVLGGTPLTVTLESNTLENSSLKCTFKDTDHEVDAEYINKTTAYCISPEFKSAGVVQFTFTIIISNTETFKWRKYVSILPVDQAHEVNVFNDNRSLLLNTAQNITFKWSNDFHPTENEKKGIRVYCMDLTTGEWNICFDVVGNDEINETQESYQLEKLRPPITATYIIPNDTIPVIFTVFVKLKAKKWSGIYFLANKSTTDLILLCNNWFSNANVSDNSSTSLQACPRMKAIIELPNSGFGKDSKFSMLRRVSTTEGYEQMYWNYFHPGSESCYRSIAVNSDGNSQYCCYKEDGELLVEYGGGSAHYSTPNDRDAASIAKHHMNDLQPFIYCCESKNCDRYFLKRPSDDGNDYVRPSPPACVYGDPHLVTLDGYKYTFNGKGEYTLLQTDDDSLTIQGRMEEAPTIRGGSTTATTFTAIVAKQPDSDAVQFQLFSVLQPVVDGDALEMENGEEAIFINVIVRREQNNSYSATFTSGVYIKLEQEFDSNGNPYVSAVIIAIPDSFKNKTSGLLGSFNDDQTDDLLPKNSATPLSLNSTLEAIHWNFGVTWIIDNENSSLFDYTTDFWSDYYDPEFTPMFEVTFTDPALEQQAEEMCQGDIYCLYDIAATGDISFGLTTLIGGQLLDTIANVSQPVFCDPPCENGPCVANDTCSCPTGYRGDLCEEKVYGECSYNPCGNGGTCREHAGTYICTCQERYFGRYCNMVHVVEVTVSNTLDIPLIVATVVPAVVIIGVFAVVFVVVCYFCKCKNKDHHPSPAAGAAGHGLYDIEEAQVKGNPLYVADEIYDILAEMSKIED